MGILQCNSSHSRRDRGYVAVAEGNDNGYFRWKVEHHTKVEWDDEVVKAYVRAYLAERLYSIVRRTAKCDDVTWLDVVAHVWC